MTIQGLIDKQLGELCDLNNSTREEIISCAEQTLGINLYNIDIITAVNMIHKEQSRRELLEMVIEQVEENISQLVEWSGCEDLDQNGIGEFEREINYAVALIEKNLSLSWDEIIKALED